MVQYTVLDSVRVCGGKDKVMTKGEMRRLRKAAVAQGRPWTAIQEDGRLFQVYERSHRGEFRHERAMNRWARRYDALNGAPESMEDR